MRNRMNSIRLIALALYFALLHMACGKYLDVKPNQKLNIPSSLADLQALLDDEQYLNQRSPRASDMSADDYFLTDADLKALTITERRTYLWNKRELFTKGAGNDWANAYYTVGVANHVLTYIHKVEAPEEEWKNVKGQALFHRANALLQITVIWAPAFDERTADTDLGIPLRMDPDVNKRSQRASLRKTYEQIIDDLKTAAELLPIVPKHSIRPSKPAAYGLLARTYLAMRDYRNMGAYATLSLHYKNTIKDYNTLDGNSSILFSFAPRFSNKEEVLFDAYIIHAPALNFNIAKIDSTLYNSFIENDLRKRVLFKSNGNATFGFSGNYSGIPNLFSGIATDEILLMRAESYAREGNASAAMEDLNRLLQHRFITGTFKPLKANNPKDALALILVERRKELMMRGLRWMDVKRLNKEGANIRLKRSVNGQSHELSPDDPRYALPIPEDVIELTGMEQNPE